MRLLAFIDRSKIAIVALCAVAAAFGLQAWKATQHSAYRSAGFPDAASYDAYMAEWSKASSTPEFREFESKQPSAQAYMASATLTADGLGRIAAVDLVARGKLYLAMLQTQESAFCARLVVGAPQGAMDDGYARKLLAAIYKAGGEQGMATWGRVSAHAALASLHQDPKTTLGANEARSLMAEVKKGMTTQERRQVAMLMTQPSMLSDRQKCEAGVNLYRHALALPQQKMEAAMQMLAAD